MNGYTQRTIHIHPGTTLSNGRAHSTRLGLIEETPLAIRIQGNPYSVVMRTPGDEIALAAGFCLTEGIVDSPADFVTLACCDQDVNVVTATLTPQRVKKIPHILERKGFVSQSSCGICGKELIDDLRQHITSMPETVKITKKLVLECIRNLSACQTRHHCSHAAAVFTREGRLLSVGEDVGRHNALDKSIGKLLLEGNLALGDILVMSSRISYELVQKAARARIPVILSVSGPTVLAVDIAEVMNIAIISLNKKDELYVFCGEQRLLHNGCESKIVRRQTHEVCGNRI